MYVKKVINIHLARQKTKVFHINSNEDPSCVTEPTPSNIETMVMSFVKYSYIYAKKAKLLKFMIFHNLTAELN